MVLLVYLFFLQRFLKCSRPTCYHICWTLCDLFVTGKQLPQPMAGSFLMIAHYIGVGYMLFG